MQKEQEMEEVIMNILFSQKVTDYSFHFKQKRYHISSVFLYVIHLMHYQKNPSKV